MRTQVRLFHLTQMLIAGLLAALFVSLMGYYGPRIEGFLLPVALAHDVEIIVDRATSTAQVSGKMGKYRKCDLISTAAYVTDKAGNAVIARIAPLGNIRLRPLTKEAAWGPWTVDIPAWHREAHLTIITLHQCHALWQTRTIFANKDF